MPSPSESSVDSDQDFDPPAEMLVDDFDDEFTIDEEESLESGESVANELNDLQRESEMPLEQLLSMYGYSDPVKASSACGGNPKAQDGEGSHTDTAPQLSMSRPSPHSRLQLLASPESTEAVDSVRKSLDLGFSEHNNISIKMGSSSRPLLRSVRQQDESSDTGTDSDYTPEEDWRKAIRVGADSQAVVPDGLSPYDDAPAYENEDRLLWDPTILEDNEVEEYLRLSHMQKIPLTADGSVRSIPLGQHVKDDEQALYMLLQCGHNIEEATRRKRIQPAPMNGTMSLWSEEECRNFEIGLKMHGKDFHAIQLNKVKTRAVSELVQFYYLWKKTERHDVFASKARIEKKKYALHPGITDFMERFMDEQENPSGGNRECSASPNCPFLDDTKKTPATSPASSTPELPLQAFDPELGGFDLGMPPCTGPGPECFTNGRHADSASCVSECMNVAQGTPRNWVTMMPKDDAHGI